MSYKTVEAIWENGKIKWIDESPPSERCRLIILYDEEREVEEAADLDFEALIAKLANIKTFQEIGDPVEWQREIRREWDRLPDW